MNRRWMFFRKEKNYFKYQVTVTAGQATTPKFTFAAGAPAAFVDWGDGTAPSAVTSDVELNHAYTTGGVYIVTLIAPRQEVFLTQIDINTDKLSQVLTPIQKFPKLTHFNANINAAWAQNISNWRLPALLQYFQVYSTSVSGDISGWVLPAPLIYFAVHATSVSGNVGSFVFPASLELFYILATSMTNCPNLDSMVSIRQILAQDTALIQASVDLYLSRCVANEADTTYATPVLNLGGTNQAPSAAGLLDKNALVALGWVVTVTA